MGIFPRDDADNSRDQGSAWAPIRRGKVAWYVRLARKIFKR